MINVLILSGENNHDWSRSTPFCQSFLKETGKFNVDVTEDPPSILEDKDKILEYDIFFLDYNGPGWGEKASQNFVEAVQQGTGVVALHAANNSFPGWVEYEKMLGLLWREGAGHGAFHEFTVKVTDSDHPITRGIDEFKIWDELYHGLTHMHNVPYEVLATAYSDPETGGTGKDEPVMITLQYGEGRIFHQILGHVWKGDPEKNKGCSMITFENEFLQKTLIRGCEWAARK